MPTGAIIGGGELSNTPGIVHLSRLKGNGYNALPNGSHPASGPASDTSESVGLLGCVEPSRPRCRCLVSLPLLVCVALAGALALLRPPLSPPPPPPPPSRTAAKRSSVGYQSAA